MSDMDYYSLKMRASQQVGEGEQKHEQHISGAERIVGRDSVEAVCSAMVRRAMNQYKDKAICPRDMFYPQHCTKLSNLPYRIMSIVLITCSCSSFFIYVAKSRRDAER